MRNAVPQQYENQRFSDMFDVRFRSKLCIPSKDTLKDMVRHDISPWKLQEIIEDGYDYEDARMTKGEVGRAIDRKNQIVFTKLVPSYSYSLDEEVWLIKHVGIKNR